MTYDTGVPSQNKDSLSRIWGLPWKIRRRDRLSLTWGSYTGETSLYWNGSPGSFPITWYSHDMETSSAGRILGLRPANERRRYLVTTSLIGLGGVWGYQGRTPILRTCVSCNNWAHLRHVPSGFRHHGLAPKIGGGLIGRVSDRDAQHRPLTGNATRVKKRGVETIHFV